LFFNNASISNRGPRIALRGKVNDTLCTGMRIIDALLPIGRGQRQLILGDRLTSKTSIFISALLVNSRVNMLGSIDGFGSKRLYGIYVRVGLNLSKLYKLINTLACADTHANTKPFITILATHSSSCAYLSLVIPSVGVVVAESLYTKGLDCLICFDDLSKHAKSFRQISLILGKIPSRDAFPADIFNIHSSLLERSFI
jgi:F-type H+-transporting ATPase subunit alpha